MSSIDLVIPNYNYGRFLRECVASAFADGLPRTRVIIIDNASTDDSLEVARELAAGDSRILVVEHEKNRGSQASFNEGIDLAEAEYMMILCADDLLLPGALREGVAALEQNQDAAFAIGPHAQTEPDVTPPRAGWTAVDGVTFVDDRCRTLGHNLTAQVIVRTSAQRAAGHYSTWIRYMDDLEVVLRLACHGAVVQLRAPIVRARQHETHLSKVFWNDRLCDLSERALVFESFFIREGATMPQGNRRHRRVKQYLAEAAYWSAASHLCRGRVREAVQLYRFGLALCPTAMVLPLGHLGRMEGAGRRLRAAVSDVLGTGSRTTPAPPAR